MPPKELILVTKSTLAKRQQLPAFGRLIVIPYFNSSIIHFKPQLL
jgi:hypothetical protein